MAHLSRAVSYVNSALRSRLPTRLVERAVERSGYRFRRRTLGPAETLLLCLGMVLSADASLAAARVRAGGAFSASALGRARARLSLLLLQVLNELIVARVLGSKPRPRVLLVDASNYYVPDTRALRRHYRHPRQKGRRGRRGDYPQARVLSVLDLHSGLMLAQFDFACDRHESPMLRRVLEVAAEGDTLVFDRGFVSFANFCLLRSRGVHFVARLASNLHAGRPGGRCRRRFVHAGRRGAGQVLWDKPARRSQGTSRRQWRKLPGQLALRQVTVRRPRGGRSAGKLVLITDLQTGAKTIANWYRRRWEIETDFRHLKATLGLEFFTTRSVQGVRRELLLRQLAYNLVREVMLRAARRLGVACGRVSFADAACLLLNGCRRMLASPSLLSVLPRRRRSSRPRRIKYRGKNYPLLINRPTPQRQIA
jgi:DDE family transposase